jgi:tetratricopeptide (TPR) repeat protein
LQVFEEEERLRAMGEDPYELQVHLSYQINHQDFEEFCEILSICHCLVAGWITDAYYYIHYDVSPLLPKLIQDLTNKVNAPQALQPIIQGVVTGYRMIFSSLINERPLWLPEMSLQLAQSLGSLPDKSWAREQTYYSVKSWLKQRNVSSPPEGVEALEILQPVLTLADQPYIDDLKICFSAFGDASVKSKLLDLDWKLKRQQKELEVHYKKGVEHGQAGKYSEASASFSYTIQLNPNYVEAYFSRGYIYAQVGHLEQAIADYGQALQLRPGYVEAYVNRGNAYYKIGNYELAIKDYNQALLLNPNLTKVAKYRDDAQRILESQKR